MIVRYGSTAALVADYHAKDAPRHARKHGGWQSHNNNAWYGGESLQDSLRMAETGDTSLVAKAEALLSQLDTAIETPRKVWERSTIGAYYSVPDVIAGLPTCARRQFDTQDDRTPITILVVTTSSAGMSAEVLAKRGTTILALVMALSRLRPVSLQQICAVDGIEGGETIITSEINTAPLDLATACYVLTSAGFARRLTYDLAAALNGFNGGWPDRMRWGNSDPYFAMLKARLVPDPTKCLIIKGAQLNDALLSDPVGWVNKQVAHFTNQVEEELA